MRKEDFNNGDQVVIEMTTYDDNYIKVISRLTTTIITDRRGNRYVSIPEYGNRLKLKNFKKDNTVKGSAGMIRSKSGKSWLNFGFQVLGGLDYIRNEKLNELLR